MWLSFVCVSCMFLDSSRWLERSWYLAQPAETLHGGGHLRKNVTFLIGFLLPLDQQRFDDLYISHCFGLIAPPPPPLPGLCSCCSRCAAKTFLYSVCLENVRILCNSRFYIGFKTGAFRLDTSWLEFTALSKGIWARVVWLYWSFRTKVEETPKVFWAVAQCSMQQ